MLKLECTHRKPITAEQIHGGIAIDLVALRVAHVKGGGALHAQTPRVRRPANVGCRF